MCDNRHPRYRDIYINGMSLRRRNDFFKFFFSIALTLLLNCLLYVLVFALGVLKIILIAVSCRILSSFLFLRLPLGDLFFLCLELRTEFVAALFVEVPYFVYSFVGSRFRFVGQFCDLVIDTFADGVNGGLVVALDSALIDGEIARFVSPSEWSSMCE
ncbi:hypothetical protein ACFQO4_18340 [Saliphagus sp. GCM10025334]